MIKSAMQELEKIDQFLRIYREFAAPEEGGKKGESVAIDPERAARRQFGQYGQAQPLFEQFVLDVLRDVKRPLQSPEIIQEFKKRGHPIAGNETRTAWNRLWKARGRGVLIHVPKYGYWLADEPLPPLPDEPRKRTRTASGQGKRNEWVGRPRGRTKILTEAQIKAAEEWIIEGKKSIKQICADLGGISQASYYVYFPQGRSGVIAKRFGLEPPPKPVRAPPGQGKPYKPSGRPARRPLLLSPERLEKAKALRAEAKTLEAVAKEMEVSVQTLRRALRRG